ncbi:TPA: TrkH family potassium uptake protein [Streptococcus suis]
MKRRVIVYLLAKILMVEGLLMLLPILIGLIYRESWQQIGAYLFVSVLLFMLAGLGHLMRPQHVNLYNRDGMVIVALGWLLLSFFGALPFVLSGEIPNIFDAFFEISSGFTTTGSSILPKLAPLANSSLFWRSFSHLIGGMGFLVFTLAILPNSSHYVQLMKAEVPGPVFGKIVSKLSGTARILYGIYLAMTLILIFILILLRVPVFDAMLLAFGTAGTGGFAINDGGFAIYQHAAAVEWVIGVGMLVFGINFNVFYFILIGFAKEVIKTDEEIRYYLGMILGVTVLIFINLQTKVDLAATPIRSVFFTVSSIITTTGYATADFELWPLFSHTLLIILMFIGGCAGSTAGGIKVSRVLIYFKQSIAEVKRAAQSGRVVVPKLSGKPINKIMASKVTNYLLVYILLFLMILVSVSIETQDFTTAFSSVAATFNNIGPGLEMVGPTDNFSFYSNWNKLVLSLGMIAGRLEIYPMIILFSPTTLRQYVFRK